MNSKQIRQQFLDFFASKQHTIVESSPVVPFDDPTLMFTNAGMNQFKDVFLGTGSRKYARAADTQKCIRAGGKHNDLDDVGQDTYHHTFFEMLGNWSFGDYFKKEAIEWAWELLTEVWGFDKDRLHATYFEGNQEEGLEPDTEAAELWKSVTDIDPTHIHPGNKKDNFWEMGDVGPCGPCSEIHVDLTPDLSGASLVNAGDPRVIELWNLVFIQFSRDAKGKLTPLPAKHVDTGMGFERLCGMLQGMERGDIGRASNYDTDVFGPVFDAIRKRTGAPAYGGTLPGEEATEADPYRDREGAAGARRDAGTKGHRDTGDSLRPSVPASLSPSQIMVDVSYRVIADHVRCLTFALTDGAIPSNEGRGYVLRRILRRAVRYGRQYMNMHEPFLCDLIEPLVTHMADAFPELRTAHGKKNVAHVTELIRDEEASCFATLDRAIPHYGWAAGAAFIKSFLETSLLYAKRGGDLDLLVEFSRGRNFSAWERADEHLTLMPHRFMLTKYSHVPSPEQPLRVFSVGDFSPRLFADLEMAPPTLSGKDAFQLHDTDGLTIDLTKHMAEEGGLTIDLGEYERLMEEARERARGRGTVESQSEYSLFEIVQSNSVPYTRFIGYEKEKSRLTSFLKVFVRRTAGYYPEEASTGDEVAVAVAETPFYAERGGQVGDGGKITTESGLVRVKNTILVGDVQFHLGKVESGHLHDDDGTEILLEVDAESRPSTMRNHTSTHLLNWALREVLGEHVQQKGSLVDPEKTRFDFSHNKPLSEDELSRIEALVRQQNDGEQTVHTKEVDQKKAREINTLRAVFGEKYPDKVRVVSIGADIDEMLADPKNDEWMKYSVEFCGGTHVKNTSEIGAFVLTHEEGVAKGVRRVVGVSGEAAHETIELGQRLLVEAGELGGGNRDEGTKGRRDEGNSSTDLASALSAFQQRVNEATIPVLIRHKLQARIGELQKLVKEQQKQSASASGEAVMDFVRKLFEDAETIGGVKVVVGEVPSAPTDKLRGAIDWVRNKTDASAVLLASVTDERVTLIAGMSKTVVAKGVKAGDLIKEIAPLVGGKGGGRPDMAQGGGSDPSGVPDAVKKAAEWLAGKLG